ncbi:MAG: ankyrin repeat domain-containing protein [Verrucomicrobiota bacterium]|jgi:ankyrin repeat protein
MNPDPEKVLAEIRDADLIQFAEVDLNGPNVRGLLGETPLHIVATWGDVESARILLNAGAEIDVNGEYDHTALHEAIGQGHLEMVKLLVSRGADLKRRNSFGSNAIELAASSKNEEIRKLFEGLNATRS